MKRSIFKYALEQTDEQTITIPFGAELLHVAEQHSQLQLRAMVDTSRPTTNRRIRIIGTGHPMTRDPGHYIGTCLQLHGALVLHVFDAGELIAAPTNASKST